MERLNMKGKIMLFVLATLMLFGPPFVLLQELYSHGIMIGAGTLIGAVVMCFGWIGMLYLAIDSKGK